MDHLCLVSRDQIFSLWKLFISLVVDIVVVVVDVAVVVVVAAVDVDIVDTVVVMKKVSDHLSR